MIFGLLAYSAFLDHDAGLGIGFAFITLVIIGVVLVLMPYQYRYDSQGVSICYFFLKKEQYRWKNIRRIYIDDFTTRTSFFMRVYRIEGSAEGKDRFYMDSTIAKTLRAKWLIEKYWHGKIEGYYECPKTAKRNK